MNPFSNCPPHFEHESGLSVIGSSLMPRLYRERLQLTVDLMPWEFNWTSQPLRSAQIICDLHKK
jgi:hypothetical protein